MELSSDSTSSEGALVTPSASLLLHSYVSKNLLPLRVEKMAANSLPQTEIHPVSNNHSSLDSPNSKKV